MRGRHSENESNRGEDSYFLNFIMSFLSIFCKFILIRVRYDGQETSIDIMLEIFFLVCGLTQFVMPASVCLPSVSIKYLIANCACIIISLHRNMKQRRVGRVFNAGCFHLVSIFILPFPSPCHTSLSPPHPLPFLFHTFRLTPYAFFFHFH